MYVHRMYEDDFEPELDSSPAVNVGDGSNRTSDADLGSTAKKSSVAAGTTPSRSSSATANKDDVYDFSNVQY